MQDSVDENLQPYDEALTTLHKHNEADRISKWQAKMTSDGPARVWLNTILNHMSMRFYASGEKHPQRIWEKCAKTYRKLWSEQPVGPETIDP